MNTTQLIEKGFYLFPLQAGTKSPYGGSWYDHTANDLEKLQAMQAGELEITSYSQKQKRDVTSNFKGCQFAVNTAYSNLLVIDLDEDTDKQGASKNGIANWKKLCDANETPPKTFTVKTPSGGYHVYFRGSAKNSASLLAPHVDVRSEGGYCVAPGSSFGKGIYTVVADHPIADAPEWLVTLCGESKVKDKALDTPAIDDVDNEGSISGAIRLLKATEGATEGSGTGNHDTFRLACRVKDLGISEDRCLDLMMDHWADRCNPNFYRDDLSVLVENAYAYGSQQIGSATASAAFSSYVTPPDFTYESQQKLALTLGVQEVKPALDFRDAADIDEARIPTRKWILGRRYIRQFASQIVAPGGVGKSMLSIVDALSISANKSLTGEPVVEQCNVWIHNAEDPIEELDMRVAAAIRFHGIQITRGQLTLTSGRKTKLHLATSVNGMAVINWTCVNAIIETIVDKHIGVFIGDPLIRLHAVKENSNEEMDVVMEALQYIAETTGCSICVIHHTRKLNGATGAGDMDAARGASSVVSAARIQYTLTTMSEDEAKKFGIDPDRRRWYAQLLDAKANMAPPGEEQVWLEKKSVTLLNGESVGTFAPAPLKQVRVEKQSDLERDTLIAIIGREFLDQGVVTMTNVAKAAHKDLQWSEISQATVETVRNKLLQLDGEHVGKGDLFSVTFINDPVLVPGNATRGVQCISAKVLENLGGKK